MRGASNDSDSRERDRYYFSTNERLLVESKERTFERTYGQAYEIILLPPFLKERQNDKFLHDLIMDTLLGMEGVLLSFQNPFQQQEHNHSITSKRTRSDIL
jgi:hypothetical protein